MRHRTTSSYRQVLADPVAARLSLGSAVSSLGDFVGLGVLLLVMYERSGQRAIGPALLFGVQAIPALLVGTVGSPWLGRVDPRRTLVAAQLVGAAAIGVVLATSTLTPVVAAAAVLGGVRAVTGPLRSGALASDVPVETRGAAVALDHVLFQAAQVAGFLAGGTAAVAGGGRVALMVDVATFVVAAAVYWSLPLRERPAVGDGAPRRRPAEGLRVIWRHPVARTVVPSTWAVLAIGALPETMTPALVEGYWVGPSLVAGAAATMLAALAVGGGSLLGDLRTVGRLGLLTPLSMLLAGVVLTVGAHPVAIVTAHAVMGVAALYGIGVQVVLARTVARDDIVHLSAAMGASLLVLEGAGALAVGAMLDVAPPLVAYGAMAVVTAVPVVWSLRELPSSEVVEEQAASVAVVA